MAGVAPAPRGGTRSACPDDEEAAAALELRPSVAKRLQQRLSAAASAELARTPRSRRLARVGRGEKEVATLSLPGDRGALGAAGPSPG